MTHTKFNVGDKVWDDVHFSGKEGIVYKIDEYLIRKIVVRVGNRTLYYTHDGREMGTAKPTLSKVPYTFELPPQPVEAEFEEGELVLVRDAIGEIWRVDRFLEINESSCRYRCSRGIWEQCIKFDPELALTNKNPK